MRPVFAMQRIDHKYKKTNYSSMHYIAKKSTSPVKMKNLKKVFFTGALFFILMLFLGACKTCKCPAYSYQQFQQTGITASSNS
jgi:hypothetical protein